jgi:outer membrane protein TolC
VRAFFSATLSTKVCMFLKTLLNIFIFTIPIAAQPVLDVKTLKKGDEKTHEQAFDLKSVVLWALEHHREVSSWEMKVKAVQSKEQDAGKLNNPQANMFYQGDSILGEDGRQKLSLGIQQTVPLTDKNSYKKDLASLKTQLIKAEYREWQIKLVYEVEKSFMRLQFLHDKLNLLDEMVEHHTELLVFLKLKNKNGEIGQHEVLQTQLELDILKQEFYNLKALQTMAEYELKQLLGISNEEPIYLSFANHHSQLKISKELFAFTGTHPRLKLQKIQVLITETMLALEKTKRWNDLKVGLEWEREREVNVFGQIDKVDSLGLELGIPLPIRMVNRGAIQSYKIDFEREKNLFDVLVKNLSQQEQRYRNRYQDIDKLIQQMKSTVMKQAEKNIVKHTSYYKQGQVSFDQLMRTQDQLLEAKEQYLELCHKKNMVWVDWRATTAKNLPQLKLEVEP